MPRPGLCDLEHPRTLPVEFDLLLLIFKDLADPGNVPERDFGAACTGNDNQCFQIVHRAPLLCKAHRNIAVASLDGPRGEVHVLVTDCRCDVWDTHPVLHHFGQWDLHTDLALGEPLDLDLADMAQLLDTVAQFQAEPLQFGYGHISSDGDGDDRFSGAQFAYNGFCGFLGEFVDRVNFRGDIAAKHIDVLAGSHFDHHGSGRHNRPLFQLRMYGDDLAAHIGDGLPRARGPGHTVSHSNGLHRCHRHLYHPCGANGLPCRQAHRIGAVPSEECQSRQTEGKR
jgi:hypothetical protein